MAFIIGLAAAIKFSAVVAAYLQGKGMESTKWLPVLSFFLVFILVVFTGRIGRQAYKKNGSIRNAWMARQLAWNIFIYDHLYYNIKCDFIFAEKMFLLKPQVITDSYTYKYIAPWGPKVINNLGNIIPFFKDMFIQLQEFFDSLAKKTT